MKKKRIWIIVGIVVVAVAAGGVYLATRQTANGQAAQLPGECADRESRADDPGELGGFDGQS